MTYQFQVQPNGYNRDEVDAIVRKLSDQYRQLYNQYQTQSKQIQELNGKIDTLYKDNNELAAGMQSKQLENDWLEQKIVALEKQYKTVTPAQANPAAETTPMLSNLLLKHALEIYLDAQKLANKIVQDAKTQSDR